MVKLNKRWKLQSLKLAINSYRALQTTLIVESEVPWEQGIFPVQEL